MTDEQVMVLPVQVVGGLVQECVILSDKLSPDQLGTWLLHHHFFGQLESSARKRRRVRYIHVLDVNKITLHKQLFC